MYKSITIRTLICGLAFAGAAHSQQSPPSGQTKDATGLDSGAPIAANTALRQVSWGMTPQDVARTESGQALLQNSTCLLYKASSGNMGCLLRYEFKDNGLSRADLAFALPRRADLLVHRNADEYLVEYDLLKDALRQKYGVCFEQVNNFTTDTKLRDAQIKRQQEEVDSIQKQVSDLREKQTQECQMRRAHESDDYVAGKRLTASQSAQGEIDFQNKQKTQRDRLTEQLQVEQDRLAAIVSASPMTGWRRHTCKWVDRNGTDIDLSLSRGQTGVSLVLTYRPSVASAVKTLTGP